MPSKISVLFLGDVVGKSGRHLILRLLPALVERLKCDFTVVNVENIAGGKGPTPAIMEEIADLPIDIYTTGSHFYDNKNFVNTWDHYPRLIRPANYPEGNPGKGWVTVENDNGTALTVLQLQGRTFMQAIDCPFRKADQVIASLDETIPILVDFHAEATSEKGAFGHYLDGRVAAVLGTHTHIPTADETIMPGGTAFITDAGMVGAYDSVIGFKKKIIVDRFLTQTPRHFDPAHTRPRISAVFLQLDAQNQHARSIRRFFVESEEDIAGLT